MRSRFSRGETARLYLDIVNAGVGITAQTPTCAIQRIADGKWFQVSDGTWQATIVENEMTQTNPAFLPGRYHFDFAQSLDTLESSTAYTVKKSNAGASARLEYEDLIFGAMSSAIAPNLCAVVGTIFTPNGMPARAEHVRATLTPVFKDAFGRGVQSDRVMLVATDENGDFSMPLVRGGVFRLEIPAIGYDRKVTIPDAPTALFTDL